MSHHAPINKRWTCYGPEKRIVIHEHDTGGITPGDWEYKIFRSTPAFVFGIESIFISMFFSPALAATGQVYYGITGHTSTDPVFEKVRIKNIYGRTIYLENQGGQFRYDSMLQYAVPTLQDKFSWCMFNNCNQGMNPITYDCVIHYHEIPQDDEKSIEEWIQGLKD